MRTKADQKKKNKSLDVHKKHFDNPFISKKKKKKRRRKTLPAKYKVYLVVTILLIGGIIWFFFYCSVWNIKNIKVKGVEKAQSHKIKELVQTHPKKSSVLFPNDSNLILLDEDEVRSQIKENFRIKKLDIDKEWPNALSIHIKEYPYAYIWQENGYYYYTNSEGFILKRIKKENQEHNTKKDIPLIQNKRERKVQNNQVTINSSFTNFIFDLYREFSSKYKDMVPKKFIIPDEAKTVKLVLKKGPSLYFDIREDPGKQIEYLLVIKNKKLEGDFQNKQYIDLRYQNKIYYQ